jgi:hypothetical protein
MEDKFKYLLVLFLSISVNSVIGAMDASKCAGTKSKDLLRAAAKQVGTTTATVASGDKYWDGSSSLREFVNREGIRSDFIAVFSTIFADNYTRSVSDTDFSNEFKKRADLSIRPCLIAPCRCCPEENDLGYQYTRAEILKTALHTRALQQSLMARDSEMWHPISGLFYKISPAYYFAFEGERTVEDARKRIYAAAAIIQKKFREHRTGLHGRLYDARVARMVADVKKEKT